MMIRTALVIPVLSVLSAASAHAGPILDFEDVVIPGETDVFLSSYASQGFTLSSSTGLQAHGSSSLFFMGSQALAGLAGDTISLSRDGGLPFSVTSIDLARNFAFDPAPTVSFTGTKSDGSTVTQAFTVTTPVGVNAFQGFTFSGFDDLVSLQWTQPTLTLGLHQFDNISLDLPVAAPEPATMSLLALGIAGLGARRWRQQRKR